MTHPIINTLIKVHQLITPITNNWILIGSSSLFLQGYPVKPNDIDILCPAAEAQQIEHLLKAYRFQPDANISRDKFRSVFSKYVIDGVKVEVMGDLEVNTPSGWIKIWEQIKTPEYVVVDEHAFKVPSRADQLTIYNFFCREKDKAILQMLKFG
ncbi:nucleotidyltransferase domain-containing protein [Mucilaginibacter sp. X4EP1]|uniref:nucleotidyltransferase domain-containing protein n=1 Tax=Mucilaginibacter sp. X4EP1 TaxID=2723092 RepID=UPI002167B6C5|nr:hypothetical protein [Mucilaginibacter sp. X4EP1]MCS3816522.1 hypothetical protein [Mucilaginibacter sp. X4EP1]